VGGPRCALTASRLALGGPLIAWLTYIWSRKTTAFGYFVVVLGVAATSNVFPPQTLKYVILTNGLLTAMIGHYNNSQLKRRGEGP